VLACGARPTDGAGDTALGAGRVAGPLAGEPGLVAAGCALVNGRPPSTHVEPGRMAWPGGTLVKPDGAPGFATADGALVAPPHAVPGLPAGAGGTAPLLPGEACIGLVR
jgi:hypothetical protein